MKPLTAALLLLLATGCARMARAVIGRPDPDAVQVRTIAATVLSCPADEMDLPVENDPIEGFGWSAQGCDRRAACRRSGTAGWECFPVPIPWWASAPSELVLTVTRLATDTGCPAEGAAVKAVEGYAAITLCGREFTCSRERCEETAESVERTIRRSSVDRLALETTCPAEQIQFVTSSAVVSGTERAYRLRACGKDYVCTTAEGRTSCQLALDHAPPVAAPL